MVSRNLGSLTVWAVALGAAAVLSGCTRTGADPPLATLKVGDRAPAFWAADVSGRPVLGWVFEGNDYLGC